MKKAKSTPETEPAAPVKPVKAVKAVRPKAAPSAVNKPAKTGAAAPPEVTAEAIAARAYALFLERGGVPGYELEDWLQAERELAAPAPRTAGRKKAAATA